MITPRQLLSIKNYIDTVASKKLKGFTETGYDSEKYEAAWVYANTLSHGNDLDEITADDILCEMLEGDTWLKSGNADVTVSTVNVLLMMGHQDLATQLNDALFMECAVNYLFDLENE